MRATKSPEEAQEYRKWVFTILRNTFIDKYRKHQHTETVNDDSDFRDDSLSESKLSDILTVRQGLENISSEYKEIIYLIDIIGFSYNEASEIINIPIGTVMSRLSRAKKALLKSLSTDERKVIPIYQSEKYRD